MTSRPSPTSSCAPRGGGASGSCDAPPEQPLDSLQAIVDDYRKNYGHRVQSEAEYFGDKRQTIEEAVRRAARSELIDGSLHDHQRRPGRLMMRACAGILAGHEEALRVVEDFAELHARVAHILSETGGVGEMIVYDIAERIGWYLGLKPDVVYLHRGTRDGARVLRPGLRGRTIKVSDLPSELAQLSAAHLENLLCICKAPLRSLRDRNLL